MTGILPSKEKERNKEACPQKERLPEGSHNDQNRGDIHDFVGHRSATSGMITHTYRHTDVPRYLEIAKELEEHLDGLCSPLFRDLDSDEPTS